MPPDQHNFEHLPLLLVHGGDARLGGGSKSDPQTIANKNVERRAAHQAAISASSGTLIESWKERRAQRQQIEGAPELPAGIPLLLQVDTNLDLGALRHYFTFEIVAEQEEGYVIVASPDIDLAKFSEMVNGFSVKIRGSATVASVHRLFDDDNDRLRRILSEELFAKWQALQDNQPYLVDVGISCAGTVEIPNYPERGKRTDAEWAKKELEWSQKRNDAYTAWDEIKIEREAAIERFMAAYGGEILHMIDGAAFDAAVLADSFTVRIRIVGRGLRDFVLNYPYIFEVVEPEDIQLPTSDRTGAPDAAGGPAPVAPDDDAPAVCVIDSGIQEGHVLLQPAIDAATSHCFLVNVNDVSDRVRPGGHGTRVAGAVLYGESIPDQGTPKLPFWIQNARVLNDNNILPEELFPPEVLRRVIDRFRTGPRSTRIFNHSINATVSCRTRYMSAWAAEIDLICANYDVLVIQSAGNLLLAGTNLNPGVTEHLTAGRTYPEFLYENSARVANPAQSLQAITVGSVAYGDLTSGEWRTFAATPGSPSAFSRTGFGAWGVIKPEVVEFGGDDVRTTIAPITVREGRMIPDACPQLVRSTMFPPGPAVDRDEGGTSFAAPKVAHVAAKVQRVLPQKSCLLYRALVIQSARWPEWAENLLDGLRNPPDDQTEDQEQQLQEEVGTLIRSIGYGIPDEERATANTDYHTTFITSGEPSIRAKDCHVYQVPIPAELRNPADEYDLRIEITLSYVAQPRRTRRNLRHYLSTWIDWKTSKLGEGLNDFLVRALKEQTNEEAPEPGEKVPWTLHENINHGLIRTARRNSGTVQKDWAVVKSNALPEQFCIAVVGHRGWNLDPDATAKYALAVSFEIVGQEIPIYDPLRTAVIELQTELELDEAEIEIDDEE